MPPLYRALAFAQVDDVAVLIGDDLDLNVARFLHIALNVHVAVAETGHGFGSGSGESLRDGSHIANNLHPFSASAGCRLEDDRKTDLIRDRLGFSGMLHDSS